MYISEQSINRPVEFGVIVYMLCTLLSAQILSTVGPVVPERYGIEHHCAFLHKRYGIEHFQTTRIGYSFFKPIVHFYINVTALSTFKRHVQASADSILTVLYSTVMFIIDIY